MVNKFLQSVDNALKILDLFSEDVPELGVSEISKRMSLGKSTVYRLLITLERRGFMAQNPVTSKYKLGITLVHLGDKVLRQLNIIKECRKSLEELSRATGETSHLALYNQGEITFVDKIAGSNPSKMGSTIGAKKPAYCTATGKALLANFSEDQIEEYLAKVDLHRYTPNTIVDIKKLTNQLKEIRVSGYAEDQQEVEEGLVCFAAPIRNVNGQVVAAISVSGSASRMNKQKQKFILLVKNEAQSASKALGWRSDC